jgi:photoactive yellow protein
VEIVMSIATTLAFTDPDVQRHLLEAAERDLDALGFGIIGFDAQGTVRRYNTFESKLSGLSRERVIGNHLFNVVAPCMNNFLVAQRFEDAAAQNRALDETIDYVFTLKMRPTKVKLRLISAPGQTLRYVLVERPS